MSDTTIEFTDAYGDTLEVHGDDSNLYLDATDSFGSASLSFPAEQAREIAVEIYRRAGGGNEGPVLASSISFNEGVIRLAAIHGKTVQFRYAKSQTAPVELRTFVPQSVQGAGDKLRFVGDDEDRGAKRSFRLDRIKGTVEVVA